MAVDFGLLNAELPGQIATSFSRGYEGAQKLAQEKEINAMNLNIKREELDKFQQDRQELLKFKEQMAKVGKTGSLENISSSLISSGIPDQIKIGIELRKEKEKHDRLAKALGQPTSDELFIPAPAAPAMSGALGSGTFGIAPEPVAAPTNAMTPAGRQLTTQEKINNLISEGFVPEANALIAQQKVLAGENQPSGRRFIHVGGGRVFDTLTKQFVQAPGVSTAASSRAASAAKEATAAPKPMTELQRQKFNKERVDELQGVKAAKSTADELETLTDQLVGNPSKKIPPHPGYERITGFQAKIPFTLPSGDAARAEQKLETFKGKISTFGRQLASQYGKLGNMAVQEWKIVSDSVQNINPAAGNLDEQMRDVVRQARNFEKSMQEKYDALYGNEANQQPSTPAQPAAKGSRTVTRTGKIDGRRVVQYSDGSVEYAD